MGKTTIYLNKEAQATYDKAKEYAGDNLSSIIAQGLTFYVNKMDAQAKGMEDQIIFEGEHFGDDDMRQGKNIKFVGRKLATGKVGQGDGELETIYTLYLTRKGKFLVHIYSLDMVAMVARFTYKIYETYAEVLAAGLPSKMLDEARKQMPDVACEELDI